MESSQPRQDPDARASDVERLERQVERGGLFTHTALSNSAERLTHLEALLAGVVDLMVERGAFTAEELLKASERARDELVGKGEALGPGVLLRVDREEPAGRKHVAVNCAERIHVCRAICCKLSFALSADEIEAGKAKWDLGRPYLIRQGADGYCTHSGPADRRCRIYAHRPGVCGIYTCATDTRIWRDFDKMELNEAWIGANLAGDGPVLVRAEMIRLASDSPNLAAE